MTYYDVLVFRPVQKKINDDILSNVFMKFFVIFQNLNTTGITG